MPTQQPPPDALPDPTDSSAQLPSPPPAPGGHAGFDPGLIDTLLRDHGELRRLFGRIGAVAKSPKPAPGELRSLLLDFKSRLGAHTLTENLRFYDFVYQQIAGDQELERMVHAFHAEMNEIELKVVAFVKRYQTHTLAQRAQDGFLADYAAMHKLFEHRLNTEEDSLYRLYRRR